MVWKVDRQIVNALQSEIDLLIKLSEGEVTDKQDGLCCFIFGMLNEVGGVTMLYKLLISKGIEESTVKKFMNYSLKMRYKMLKGKWSWSEMDQFKIPWEEVKDCSTDYQLPNN